MKFLQKNLKSLKKFLRNHFTKLDIVLCGVFICIFLITRLYNLLQIPVFVDEGNYIVWAKRAIIDHAYFITLTDGKPPIPTWNAAAFIWLTPNNMLYGLRLSSVFAGLLALIGFFILSYQLFGKRTAFISTFLYMFTPFILFYDRLGVVDSLVNAASIFILITSIIFAKKRTFWSCLLFGFACGVGILIKSNIWIPILASFFAPLLVYKKGMKLNEFIKIYLKFLFLYIISIVIAEIMFRVQLLAPYPNAMELISNKNSDFLYNYHEILADPTGIFWKNVPDRTHDLIQMTGWISFFVAMIGFIHLFIKKKLESVYLFIWFSAPLFAVTYLVKYYAARYMVFIATLVMLMAGYMIASIKNKTVALIFSGCMMLSFIYFAYGILLNYHKLDFPRFEREQYVEGIASGYGLKEIAQFATEKSKKKPVLILGEGIFGLGSNMIESAFPLHPQNIEITGLWPFNKEVLKTFQPQLKDKQVYVFLNFETVKKIPKDWPLKLIKEYKKPYPTHYFRLYELTK